MRGNSAAAYVSGQRSRTLSGVQADEAAIEQVRYDLSDLLTRKGEKVECLYCSKGYSLRTGSLQKKVVYHCSKHYNQYREDKEWEKANE